MAYMHPVAVCDQLPSSRQAALNIVENYEFCVYMRNIHKLMFLCCMN